MGDKNTGNFFFKISEYFGSDSIFILYGTDWLEFYRTVKLLLL